MIHALLQYAEDRGLVSKPGYTKKTVKWVLNFDKWGNKFTGIVSSDKNFLLAADLSQGELKALGAKRKSMGTHFLIAPIGAIIGWGKDDKEEQVARKKQETFVWMLNEASLYDQALKSIASVLLDPDTSQSIREESKRVTAKPQDLATICLGGRFPADENTWHEWWDKFRATLVKPEKKEIRMPNFGTGELSIPVLTHPKVKKLSGVGLSQPHAPLVTFDKEAYESYGLSQGMNAAMDVETANAYVNAIDNLLENSVIYRWYRPGQNAGKQIRVDYAKIGGARIAYWYMGPSEIRREVEERDDLIAIVLGSADKEEELPEDPIEKRILAEARLRKAIDRISSGEHAVSIGNIHFCILALSGAGGRIMVRDFIEGSILQLSNTTEQWFSNLSLDTYWGKEGPLPSLEQVLTAPLSPRKQKQKYIDWVAPAGAWRQSLWRAAFTGGHLPETAFARALYEHNNTVVRGDLADDVIGSQAQRRSRLRLAIVKAYLIRKGVSMQPALDPEHPSAAYHCGRLLAVYDSLQRAALGDVGAGIVQRFYGGALTNPSGVFGQLSRMAQTHLAKLDRGLAYIYAEQIAEIHNGIRKSGDNPATYPSALDLDGQALFALGFWHQTAVMNRERSEAVDAKKAREEKAASEIDDEEEDNE
ncbi:MAG TPA: type I-C CRISPR-associated protein Cas8c/Csd1 [Rectinema sp.]|nr:type I-C CRISPR-associated protein Cas8c/Csd1 [Rectinema sp.]